MVRTKQADWGPGGGDARGASEQRAAAARGAASRARGGAAVAWGGGAAGAGAGAGAGAHADVAEGLEAEHAKVVTRQVAGLTSGQEARQEEHALTSAQQQAALEKQTAAHVAAQEALLAALAAEHERALKERRPVATPHVTSKPQVTSEEAARK